MDASEKISDWVIIKDIIKKYIIGIPLIRNLIFPVFASIATARYLEVYLAELGKKLAEEVTVNNSQVYTKMILTFALIASFSSFLMEFIGYIFTKPIQRAGRVASKEIFKHYIELEYLEHHEIGSGKICASIERKSKAIADVLEIYVLNILPLFLTVLFAIISIYKNFSYLPTFIVAFALILYTISTLTITKKRNKIRIQLNLRIDHSSNLLYDDLSNFDSIVAYNNQAWEVERFDDSQREIEIQNTRLYRALYSLNFIQRLIFVTMSCVIIYLGLHNYLEKNMSPESLLLYISLSRLLSSNLSKLGYLYSKYSQAMMNAKTSYVIPHSNRNELNAVSKLKIESFNSEIRLKDVGFSFNSRRIFSGINLCIKKGQKIAIVGKNGTGKSTFIKTILAFYDVEGSIFFDGVDIKNICKRSLRELIAYVPQDASLFNESVKYNIKYSAPLCSDYDMIGECQKLKVHDSFTRLESGYSTIVGERGMNLSGGERQKAALMRAMLKRANILILDEPTANLDKKAEFVILDLILKNYKDATLLMIVHNLSLLKHFDKIVFLSNGTLKEYGSHDELMELKGSYYNFFFNR